MSETLVVSPGSSKAVHVWRRVRAPAAVLLIVFLVYVVSPVTQCMDSKWSIPAAQSMIRRHDTNLDEYAKETRGDYAIAYIGGHIYNAYPLGASLVAVPLVYALDVSLPYLILASPALRQRFEITSPPPYPPPTIDGVVFRHRAYFEKVIASFVVALSAVIVFLIARVSLGLPLSLVAAGMFAFCTSAWSAASRALWQHGPSMLMLAIALYLLLLSRKRESLARYVSLPLAFSFVTRPTNSISVLLLTCYVFVKHRKQILPYLLWALPVAVPFFVYNWATYHALVSPYYAQRQLFSTSQFWVALAGQAISPGRGIFIYSPVFVLTIVGVVWKVRDKQIEALDYFLVAVIAATVLIHSYWSDWWGGTVYGPRLLSDMVPFLVYLLLPALAAIARLSGARRGLLLAAGGILSLISIFMHGQGALNWQVYRWYSDPISLPGTWRLWDWRDPMFLRGILPNPGDPALRRVGGAWKGQVASSSFGREWGRAVRDQEASQGVAWLGAADTVRRGALVFGPYLSAPAGDYEATFRAAIAQRSGAPVTFDVFCSGEQWDSPLREPLAAMSVRGPTSGYQELVLPFSVPRSLSGHFVGTRVISNTPGVEVRLDEIGIRRVR